MTKDNENIRKAVYQRYSGIASTQNLPDKVDSATSCCGPVLISPSPQKAVSCCDPSALRPAESGLGCGNPLALASLKPGETVVDLGCGGGFECFAAAGQVGDMGRVIGVDMTPDMIGKARANAEKIKAGNVEFRLGEIEHLPIADNTADIIISNCVINLAPDKLNVYREAFRVLKPGGRLAISDTMTTAPLPEEIKKDLGLWSCCISGAVTAEETKALLEEAGFTDIRITENKESRELAGSWTKNSGLSELGIVSAYIEAVKPF
jgi:arsenite methyltransferase